MREAKSFCRTCIAQCGLVLSVGDDDRIVSARADHDHPISDGYACFKGLQVADNHYGADRLLHSLKRMPDGRFVEIPVEQALDEIAERLGAVRDAHGLEAVGLFRGTAAFHNSTAFGIHGPFLKAIGSRSLFTTLSIDQSAKGIAYCRIGRWHAGRHHFDQCDVSLMFGCNPLISHSAGSFLVSDPVKRIKKAVARGMKFIVVDPRRSETAQHAAIHLQPHPGEDVSIAAGFLRLILSEGWHDQDFCARYVSGLDALRAAVEPFTPGMVAARAGIDAGMLREAAELFAVRSKRGGVVTGTGNNMGPRSNLAEHLVQCIEVVCGRFKRAGDVVPNEDPLAPQRDWYAEVTPPSAPWDAAPPSRIRGVGDLFGEKLTATLAEEITTPGSGQIRALIVNGANIANSVPDKKAMEAALRSLDLLVAIVPHMTPTAQLADYVIAPRLQFERADLPITLGFGLHADAWVQYTPAVAPPPAGSEVVDDWYVFWGLAKRLGLQLIYAGQPLDMENPPTTDALLEYGMRGTAMTLAELKARPDQLAVSPAGVSYVKPARPGAAARMRLDPEGVLDELAEVAAEAAGPQAGYPFRLIVRRMRDLNGSIGMGAASIRRRNPFNPLRLNPQDMARRGLAEGMAVDVVSPDGRLRAVVAADDTLRAGVVSMSHNWGGLGDDPADYAANGASTNLLVRADVNYEGVNAMPRMTAIPVDVVPIAP
jgi:anaerobic selenocysteine-containing dehydrogenase